MQLHQVRRRRHRTRICLVLITMGRVNRWMINAWSSDGRSMRRYESRAAARRHGIPCSDTSRSALRGPRPGRMDGAEPSSPPSARRRRGQQLPVPLHARRRLGGGGAESRRHGQCGRRWRIRPPGRRINGFRLERRLVPHGFCASAVFSSSAISSKSVEVMMVRRLRAAAAIPAVSSPRNSIAKPQPGLILPFLEPAADTPIPEFGHWLFIGALLACTVICRRER